MAGKKGRRSNTKGPGPQSRPGQHSRTSTRVRPLPSVRALADPMTPAERIVWYCIHALVLLVPLAISNWTVLPWIDRPWTYDQFDIVKTVAMRAITLVAFGAWAWHVLVEGGKVRRTKVDYLILAVLGWMVLSTVFSIHPPTAIFGKYRRYDGLLSFLTYGTIYFLAVQVLDRISRIRALARTLFYSGTAVSFYGVLQYLGLDPFRWGDLPFEPNRAFSTFGNPNLLGGFLVFPLVISLALALSEEEHGWRIAYWSGFLITAVCWVVAFTRGAWIGGAVGLVLLGIAAWRLRARLTRVDQVFAGSIAGVLTLVVARSLTADHAVMNVWKRLASIFEFDQGSALTRFQIWDAAWRAALDRPVFGFGLDTFRLVFPQYKSIEYVQTVGWRSVADNVHNYILQSASAIGLPGVLLLYGLFVAVGILSARAVFARREAAAPVSPAGAPGAGLAATESGRLVLVGFWAAAAAHVIHLAFGISVTGSTFLLWLSMAALMAPGARVVEVHPPAWGRIAAGAAITVLAVASVGNGAYIAADHLFLKGARPAAGTPFNERLSDLERAVALNPYNDMYRTEIGTLLMGGFESISDQIAEEAKETGQVPEELRSLAREYFVLAEESLLDTVGYIEYEYDNYVTLLRLYGTAEIILDPAYSQTARVIAAQAIELSPTAPMPRVLLANIQLRAGELDEARANLEYALEADPRIVEGNALLGDVYLQQGDPAAALERYERAAELGSEDASLRLQEKIGAVRALIEDDTESE